MIVKKVNNLLRKYQLVILMMVDAYSKLLLK